MSANVLNSKRAVAASVEVVRAFVRLRQMVVSNTELASKLAGLEKKYDAQSQRSEIRDQKSEGLSDF